MKVVSCSRKSLNQWPPPWARAALSLSLWLPGRMGAEWGQALSVTHLKTKVPPAPWPSTSLGLKEIFPTTTRSGSASARERRQPSSSLQALVLYGGHLLLYSSGHFLGPTLMWPMLIQQQIRHLLPSQLGCSPHSPPIPSAPTFSSHGDSWLGADHPISRVLQVG